MEDIYQFFGNLPKSLAEATAFSLINSLRESSHPRTSTLMVFLRKC